MDNLTVPYLSVFPCDTSHYETQIYHTKLQEGRIWWFFSYHFHSCSGTHTSLRRLEGGGEVTQSLTSSVCKHIGIFLPHTIWVSSCCRSPRWVALDWSWWLISQRKAALLVQPTLLTVALHVNLTMTAPETSLSIIPIVLGHLWEHLTCSLSNCSSQGACPSE